jgi:hypothetical protein
MGCGYHFRDTGEPVGIRIESLAIPLFSSTSSEMGFEADFTTVIRQQFISKTRIPLAPEEKAHMVLIGKIQDVKTDAVAYRGQDVTVGGYTTTYNVTSSRRLEVRLDVQLLDKRSGKVIWRDSSMRSQASYIVSSDPLETRDSERRAVKSIASDLAKIIYMRTMERW